MSHAEQLASTTENNDFAETTSNGLVAWLRKRWRSTWFPTFTSVHRWWRERFTMGGKIVVALLIVCVPGVWSTHFGHLYLFVALATTLLLCLAANLLFTPKLSAQALPPVSVDADRPFELPLRIENDGKLPAFDLQTTLDNLPTGWELTGRTHAIRGLAAGQISTYTPVLIAKRRGRFKLPRLRATHFFPLNLLRRRWQVPLRGHLLVLPRYNRMDLPIVAAVGQCEGYASSLQRGSSCDATGIREYQPGIPVRRWDYASWARLGYPVIREYEDSQQQLAAVVLDNFATREEMQRETFEEAFEAAVSRTASVAAALDGAGITIKTLWIGAEQHQIQTAAGENGLVRVLRLLANAKPRSSEPTGNEEPFWQEDQHTTTYVIVRKDCERPYTVSETRSAPVVVVQTRDEDIALNQLQEAPA